MKARHLYLVAACTLCGPGAAFANIVSNPSLEEFTGSFSGDGGAQLISASTSLTGWHVTNGEIAVLKNGNFYKLTASEGDNFLDLAGYSNSGFPKGITETLSLTPGQIYRFTMDLGIRNGACVGAGDNCHGPIQVMASIGGVSETFTHNSPDPGNIWGTYGFQFRALDASEDLTIRGISLPPGNAYIGLDDIRVNAVPEPTATIWLLAAGSLLLGVLKFRRCR